MLLGSNLTKARTILINDIEFSYALPNPTFGWFCPSLSCKIDLGVEIVPLEGQLCSPINFHEVDF